NIRVSPWHCIPGAPQEVNFQLQYASASSSLEMRLLPFSVLRAQNYLQIVHYQDRYVMRNGYTRAVEVLLKSIHTVPCLRMHTENRDRSMKHIHNTTGCKSRNALSTYAVHEGGASPRDNPPTRSQT